MTTSFLTIDAVAAASIEAKRSVFRCELTPVADETAARAAVEESRKAHWDARHHCSAFVLGPERAIRRSNDDGEPSGTAGRPILDALLGADVTNVVVVVARWFGGTLLGTGGLVKAYGEATQAALAQARFARYALRDVLRTDVDLADVGRIENAMRAAGCGIRAVEYPDTGAGPASLEVSVTPADQERIGSLLAELTSGERAFTRLADPVWERVQG